MLLGKRAGEGNKNFKDVGADWIRDCGAFELFSVAVQNVLLSLSKYVPTGGSHRER